MNRIICAFAVVLLSLCTTSIVTAEPPADSLAVRIVPSSTNNKGGHSITLFLPAQHFYVVITNVSKEPVRLWREWCSWGYYSLSFSVVGPDGKDILVKKKQIGWTKNFPDSTTLAPGDHLVFEVTFDQAVWPDAPVPDKGKSREVKMKAVFAIAADDESKQHGVWVGEVSSPVASYTIYR